MILFVWMSASLALIVYGIFALLWGLFRMAFWLVWAFLKALVISFVVVLYAAVELAREAQARRRLT